MILAALILVISTGLLFSYLQAICQRILRQEFKLSYFQAVVNANRLGFISARNAAGAPGRSGDYAQLRTALKCDYLALTYLLKNAANVKSRYAPAERLLMVYFRVVLFSLALRHRLGLGEKPAILRLTDILQYFANVVGERVSKVRYGNLAASEYVANV